MLGGDMRSQRFRNRVAPRIAYMPQGLGGNLYHTLTVDENIAFFADLFGLRGPSRKDQIDWLLEATGLLSFRDRPAGKLSGGMKRRVALARAIALDPALMMYDEPFVGQDPISMGVLVRLIRLLNDAMGLTSIVVSHDLAETASIADYLYVVGDGQVLGQGTPDELMNSDNPRIRQFMQGEPDGPVPFHYPAQDDVQDLMQTEKDA